MSTEVEIVPTLPAFSRPTSLYLPDVPRSSSLLDTTSYSPFPTFPGSGKTRDPYGLNAYLLHPDDSLWSYVDPIPQAPHADHQHSTSLDGSDLTPVQSKSVRKQRSLSLLKRPSPLGAQPPVSAEGSEDESETSKPLVRRRSSSMSSSPTLSVAEAAAVVATFRDEISQQKTPKPKKSLRKAFSKARKSVFGMTDGSIPIPPVPPIPEPPASVAPSMSVSSSEDLGPTTPMSTRSNSNYSTTSSASSTSSSEGVKTPADGVPVEIAITGTKLANALLEVGGSKKGKTWGRWLGSKKGKVATKDSFLSGDTTPVSDSSASSTPNSSSPNLLAGALPKLTLTPSPAINTPPSKTAPLIPPTEPIAIEHTWATDQLRRISMRKISQLKAPSPHPLALALRRQHSRLPEEVASHIQAGQRVFPMSVNSSQGAEGGLLPAQGGLRVNLAIGYIMVKLDRGEQPECLLQTRRASKRSIVPRPGGIHDFIARPPFEERNIVYYPGNVFSPISMARPGYGVWDLDFSAYILALSEADDPSPSWPTLPRTSIAVTDELEEIIKSTTITEERIVEEQVELLPSPTFKTIAQVNEVTLQALNGEVEVVSPAPSAEPAPCPSPTQRPLSSFRNLSGRSNTSASASSSESSAEESEADEDDEPLAQIAKRRSLNFQPQAGVSAVFRSEQQRQVRSSSQPADKRLSRAYDVRAQSQCQRWAMSQQTAMEEVARARSRRTQNLLGEAERRAEAEQMQKRQVEKRSSLTNLRPPTMTSGLQHRRTASIGERHSSRRPSSFHTAPSARTSPRAAAHDSRRRTHTTLPSSSHVSNGKHLTVSRPEVHRGRSNPEQREQKYHSFYEHRSASSSAPTFHSQPSYRLPPTSAQHFVPAFLHPQRMSMMFPHQPMMSSQPHLHGHGMFVQPHLHPSHGSLAKRSSSSRFS